MAAIKKIIGKNGVSYKITVSLGRNLEGKQIRKHTTYVPEAYTKTGKQRSEKSIMQDVEAYARQYEKECREGKVPDRRITVKILADRWMEEYCKMQLSPGTIRNHRGQLTTRIIPEFGHMKIADVTPYAVQKFINACYSNSVRFDGKDGKPLSPASVLKTYSTMRGMFAWAVEQGFIDINPCERVRHPRRKKDDDKVKAWDLDQTMAFLRALDMPYAYDYKAYSRASRDGSIDVTGYTACRTLSSQIKLFFHIALFCGMRRGEIIALRWPDIDLTNQKIHVSRSVIEVDGEVIEKEPKTSSSRRTIAIDGICADLLARWQREQFVLRNNMGSAWKGDNYVFIQRDGSRMYPGTPYRKFRGIISYYNAHRAPGDPEIPEIAMHGLRHTSATLLIANGIDIKTVSARLGHARTSTTADIYAHALEKTDTKAADTLSSLLRPNNPDVRQLCTKI